MKKILLIFCCVCCLSATAQHTKRYNLPELYLKKAFVPSDSVTLTKPDVLTTVNTIWFKSLTFSEGTIDIDLRGRNVFLRSFLGIAFHGTDSTHYDLLYFRPFNFKSPDTLRRKWSVAYVSLPDYNWPRLRKEHPLVFENAVQPVPDPDAWFHATIVIKAHHLTVYVDHSTVPCLVVTLLNSQKDGRFGLFSDGLQSDFKNLTITR